MNAPLGLAELSALGEQLGAELPAGAVVWLDGPLGAGKTTLARAIAQGRGVGEAATSPTYALVHHYHGPRGDLYHLDCYRLRTPDDAADLAWDQLATADLLLIEWPERAGAWALAPSVRVAIGHAEADTRTVIIS
ncbi:MAG: tRNA (adenosine(37)-N6)-threonylcarbamoyltransferase complex ATPase subunit type 1 TsaE [Gemmatimonadales bacterium]|nr:tRNA (adenosine(37)-N6)-threonylcarbamoyltransferase complex ATPase subunit type 1 TsaE [Gemmatimonadales bacterium]